jgi:energy-coupling factor transport system substrate-specific component
VSKLSNAFSTSNTGTTTAVQDATARTSVQAQSPLAAWRTIDLITVAMLGAAFGVAYWGWDFAWTALDPVFKGFPPLSGLLGGPWLIAGVVTGLIVRRPGAALYGELVAAVVEMALGNQWAWLTVVSGLLEGVGVEIVLAIFLYRRFGPVVAAAGGALAALCEAVFEWVEYYPDYSIGWKLAYAAIFALSGAVVAGVGGWLLTRALAETGALSPFPPGQEALEARAT